MVAPEERLARVEGVLEEIRTRMNHLESRFASLEERIDRRLTGLEERMDRRLGQLLWVSVTMWATLMAVVLTLGLVR